MAAKKRRRVFTVNPSKTPGYRSTSAVAIPVDTRKKGSGIIVDPANARVGVGSGDTSATYNAGSNTVGVGSGGVQGSYNIGTGDIGASRGGTSVGYNPSTGNMGASQNVYSSGNTNVEAGVGYNSRTGNVGPSVGVSQGYRSGNVSGSVGMGYGASGPSAGARVQIGKGEGNSTGATAGGMAGTIAGTAFFGPVGGFVGGAVGSAAGSVIGGAFNPSQGAQDHVMRTSFRNALTQNGIFDEGGKLQLPDGTIADMSLDGADGLHGWKNPQDRVEQHQGKEGLHSYDTDYTNDLDYVANMAGNTLTRSLAGGTGTPVDQVGAQLGNQLLGKAGYGAEMTKENFTTVMQNARAAYARAGIGTKEDLLALNNQAFADGRLNDFDYAAANQTAGLVFDNDFTAAQQLMNGRKEGVTTAAKTPSSSGQNNNSVPQAQATPQGQNPPKGWVQMPTVGAAEAIASVQPFVDYYRSQLAQNGLYGEEGGSPTMGQRIQEGAALVRAGAGAAGAIRDAYNRFFPSDKPNPGGLGVPVEDMNYNTNMNVGSDWNYGDSSSYGTTGTGASSDYQVNTDVTSEYGSGGSGWDSGSNVIDGLTVNY